MDLSKMFLKKEEERVRKNKEEGSRRRRKGISLLFKTDLNYFSLYNL
jgi:hypothetical protein